LDGKLDTHVTLLVFFHQTWRAREPIRAVAVATPLATSGAQFALKHECSGAAIAAANVDLAQGILMMIASATALAVTGAPAQNSTIATTMGFYSHVLPSIDRNAAEQVEKAFAPAIKPST